MTRTVQEWADEIMARLDQDILAGFGWGKRIPADVTDFAQLYLLDVIGGPVAHFGDDPAGRKIEADQSYGTVRPHHREYQRARRAAAGWLPHRARPGPGGVDRGRRPPAGRRAPRCDGRALPHPWGRRESRAVTIADLPLCTRSAAGTAAWNATAAVRCATTPSVRDEADEAHAARDATSDEAAYQEPSGPRYVAHITPEAWQRDEAVEVDAPDEQ
jgi:hypothetical protein